MKSSIILLSIIFISLSQIYAQKSTLKMWGSMTGFINHPVKAIAAGNDHTMALQSNGTVVVWGPSDEHQQLQVPEDLTDVVAIASGYLHCLALKNDGTVVAWGDNRSDECSVPTDLKKVKNIAAGDGFSVALQEDGVVRVWGGLAQEQQPANLGKVKQVSAGEVRIDALREDGTVVSWGYELCSEVKYMTNITKISSKGRFLLGLKDNMKLDYSCVLYTPYNMSYIVDIAMGQTFYLSVDWNGNVFHSDKGTLDLGGRRAIAVAAGYDHAAVLLADSSVYHWNRDLYATSVPQGLGQIKEISASINQVGVLTDNGNGYLFGQGYDAAYYSGKNVKKIIPGIESALILLNDSTLNNVTGTATSFPSGIKNVIYAAFNGYCEIVMRIDSTIEYIGYDSQLGDGIQNLPSNLTNIKSIGIGNRFAAALKYDGTVLQWGSDPPIPPSGIPNIQEIAVGQGHVLALKKDGTLIGWGDNTNGQITIPSGLEKVKAIATAVSYSVALKEDGTIVIWGTNPLYTNILKIPKGLKNVKAIAACETFVVALMEEDPIILSQETDKVLMQDLIRIYPNPSKGILTVENDGLYNRVDLYNSMGFRTVEHLLSVGNNNLDLSNLPKGLYYCDIIGIKNERNKMRLILE